jgi:hypothetical protein
LAGCGWAGFFDSFLTVISFSMLVIFVLALFGRTSVEVKQYLNKFFFIFPLLGRKSLSMAKTTEKPKPPRLKVDKKVFTFSLPTTTKSLLERAAEATGIDQSAYVNRALLTQMKRDGIE